MDKLILPDMQKAMLLDVIEPMVHFNKDSLVDDAPQEATLILLHGGPGTGKTLSSTYIAEYLRRPLVSLSPEEVGTTTAIIASSLRNLKVQAERWNAIAVIDDLDYIFERRVQANMNHNSVMTMCIHLLESYSGVLILTTTRPGAFDELLLSRVRLAIEFPTLNFENRMLICHDLIREDRRFRDLAWEDKNTLSRVISKYALNGKQVKNILEASVRYNRDNAAGEVRGYVASATKFVDYLAGIHHSGLEERAASTLG